MRILLLLLVVGVVVGMEIEPVVEGVDVVWNGVERRREISGVEPVAFPRAQGRFDLWTALPPRDAPLPLPAYPRVRGQNEATVVRDSSSLREMIDKSPWVGKTMQEVGESSAQGASRQVGQSSKQAARKKKKGCFGCFG